MILFRYFLGRFLRNFVVVFGALALFYLLVDMVEVARKFASADPSLGQILRLSALRLPEGLYQVLPLAVILTSLTMFIGLARSSELVVTRAAGLSALRALSAPIFGALLLGILAYTAFNPIVAATKRQYQAEEANLSRAAKSVLSISRNGLWLRQGDDSGQTVIRAASANADATAFVDVTFLKFDEKGLPIARIEAARAELEAGKWHLTQAKQWAISPGSDVEATAGVFDALDLASDLTPDSIREGFADPSSMPWWELPTFIQHLEAAGFSARRHVIWMQAELARPLFLVGMVLIGAVFTMRNDRGGGRGWMVMAALGVGFGLYFIGNLARILGENGQIPLLLAAWAPPLASVLLGLGILMNLEDG